MKVNWGVAILLASIMGSSVSLAQEEIDETDGLAIPPILDAETTGPSITPGLWEIEIRYENQGVDASSDKGFRGVVFCYTPEMAQAELNKQLLHQWADPFISGLKCEEIERTQIKGMQIIRKGECRAEGNPQRVEIISDYHLEGSQMRGTVTTQLEEKTLIIETVGRRVGECPSR